RESYLSMSKTALFYSQVLKNKSDAKRHRTYFLNLMAMISMTGLIMLACFLVPSLFIYIYMKKIKSED
ncbi:hypothetical protein ABE273_00005, partial [Bacillus paranthracis]